MEPPEEPPDGECCPSTSSWRVSTVGHGRLIARLDRGGVESRSGGDVRWGRMSPLPRTAGFRVFAGALPHTRRVALRMAIVFGDGPATNMLFTLARTGLGGPQIDSWWFSHRRYRGIGASPTGDGRTRWHRTRGRQKFSWIHIADVVGAVRFLRDRDDISGPVNLAAPSPTDNAALMRALRRTVRMPIGLPAWRWMLEPAMWVLRTEPELVLKSRWVVPGILTRAGYPFAHTDLESTLTGIQASRSRGGSR